MCKLGYKLVNMYLLHYMPFTVIFTNPHLMEINMKTSIALAITLASLSTSAMAETPAMTKSQPAPAAGMPAMGADMSKHMGGKRHGYMKERMERMWKEMDTNNDGSISKEESTAFGNKKFDEKDANHDGKVTREEWDAFHTAKMEEMKARMEKRHENMPMGDKKQETPAEPKK